MNRKDMIRTFDGVYFSASDIVSLIYFAGIQFDFFLEKKLGVVDSEPFSAVLLQNKPLRHAAFAGVPDEMLDIIELVRDEQTSR